MLGERREVVIFGYIGIAMLIIAWILETLEVVSIFVSCGVAIIAFGISVAVKLMINQYIEVIPAKVIRVLSINNMIKLLALVFYFYFRINFYSHYLEGERIARLILAYIMLDFIGIMVIFVSSICKKEYMLGKWSILLSMSIQSIICMAIPVEYISEACGKISLISIVVASITCYWWRGIPYCRLYLIFEILQSFAIISLDILINEYYLCTAVFEIIQNCCIIVYTYQKCLLDPWNHKLEALSEAEKMIHKQNETCNVIVNLSHELKTPVNVIRSGLDILALDYRDDTVILEEVKGVKKDCNQMMNIIQNMIDIQKIQGNYMRVKYDTYNLVEVVESVIDAFTEQMQESSFVFNPLEEEVYQNLDVSLMQQCFMLLFQLFIKWDRESQLYVELGKYEENGEVYILIRHNKIQKLLELNCSIEDIKGTNRIAEVLNFQLVTCILELQNIAFEYEENYNIKMTFPKCLLTTDKWLDEEYINVLKDQIKVRDIVG